MRREHSLGSVDRQFSQTGNTSSGRDPVSKQNLESNYRRPQNLTSGPHMNVCTGAPAHTQKYQKVKLQHTFYIVLPVEGGNQLERNKVNCFKSHCFEFSSCHLASTVESGLCISIHSSIIQGSSSGRLAFVKTQSPCQPRYHLVHSNNATTGKYVVNSMLCCTIINSIVINSN